MLKETLEQSLLALSQSDTVHYETTCAEISNTRLALLKLEDVNIKEFCDMEAEFAAWNKFNKEVKVLQEQKELLRVQIMKLEDTYKELQIKTLGEPEG